MVGMNKMQDYAMDNMTCDMAEEVYQNMYR